MAVLVTCKFEEDSIKSECAIFRTTFLHFVYGKIFHPSRASNSKANSPIWPKIELIRDFKTGSLPASLMKSRSKLSRYPPGNFLPIISL